MIYCVKTNNGITESFSSTCGVKQGCNLSPTLANVYQNDLHDLFDNECTPVELAGLKMNLLSWADDLVLMSSSAAGLQRWLNKLEIYCYKWNLEVNNSKTKCMVFNCMEAVQKSRTLPITDSS